jgi:ankyrin repeat protein
MRGEQYHHPAKTSNRKRQMKFHRERTVNRAILLSVVLSMGVGGCNRTPQNANPKAAGSNRGSVAMNPDQEAALQAAVNEHVVDPLAKSMGEAVKKMADANPGFMEQLRKRTKTTPLHQAAWDNRADQVKKLLAAHADVNARNFQGSTPLHSAAYAFGAEVIPMLVEAGSDVNARDNTGRTPLHVAMIGSNSSAKSAIPYLLQAKADVNAVDDDGCTPLVYLFRYQNPCNIEKLRQLMEGSPNVNLAPKGGFGPLHWASSESTEAVDILIAGGANINAKTDEGKTPLYFAAQVGLSNAVASLLKAKADPNCRDSNGWSPLVVAADMLHNDVVVLLQKAGAKEPSWNKLHQAIVFGGKPASIAEIAKDKSLLNARDAFGRTPLYWAIRSCNAEGTDLLVAAGANVVSANEHQASILPVAIWAGRADIAKKAIAAGENVNVADRNGYSALHFAAAGGNDELVQLLLEKGAPVNARSKSGENPLMFAIHCKKPEVFGRLLAAGADVLAANSEGKSIADRLWEVGDEKVETMLKAAIGKAEEKRIDRICYLYSADNPHALKAGAIRPSTPNLAAVKMVRALLGADRKAFAATFVGDDSQIAVVNALYDVSQSYMAFRKELTNAYGPDACQEFAALEIDGVTWNVTVDVAQDERCFEQMKVYVQGDRAVCHDFPGFRRAGDVEFVKQGDNWRIYATFLTSAAQPDANLSLFNALVAVLQKGRQCIKQSGNGLGDVKREMIEELKRRS